MPWSKDIYFIVECRLVDNVEHKFLGRKLTSEKTTRKISWQGICNGAEDYLKL
jgi:hypothetical protein